MLHRTRGKLAPRYATGLAEEHADIELVVVAGLEAVADNQDVGVGVVVAGLETLTNERSEAFGKGQRREQNPVDQERSGGVWESPNKPRPLFS